MSKKWTEERVKERLMPLLKGLGRNCNQVVKSLEQKGIQGYCGDPSRCPIALLIKKQFKSAKLVDVDSDYINLYFGCLADMPISVKTTKLISKFIDKFDAYEFPTLTVDEDYEDYEDYEEHFGFSYED